MATHHRRPPGPMVIQTQVSVIPESCVAPTWRVTSRKHRVTAATLTDWRERFLAGGEAVLKGREVDIDDQEKRRLKSVVANVSVDNELLNEKIARLDDDRPLAFWSRHA